MSIFFDQYEFMKAAGNTFPECKDRRLETLAIDLINEEWSEFSDEPYYLSPTGKKNKGSENCVKEALDLIYVTAQYLNTIIGPDKAQECWDALQANNMSKCTDGVLVKRDDGKVLKNENYKKLDLTEILK